MPIIAIIIFVIIIAFIQDHWQTILIIIGIIVGAIALLAGGVWLNERRAVEARLRAEAEKNDTLRNEPLLLGETVEQRIKKRYLETCEADFDRIADLRRRSGEKAAYYEIKSIINIKLMPALSDAQREAARQIQQSTPNIFDAPIRLLAAQKEKDAKLIAQRLAADIRNRYHPTSMTPQEFEHWCKDMLNQQGWQANVVGGAGDQGADVIAKKAGLTLVLQCKYYSAPVGNKAVQEVHAARSYYNATHAAVVTNHTYTRGGVALANRTGVLLLSATELMNVHPYL